jgi:hypothetical protein
MTAPSIAKQSVHSTPENLAGSTSRFRRRDAHLSSRAPPNFHVRSRLTRTNSPRTRVSPFAVPKTRSAFHRHVRQNAFRSHARQQFKPFARQGRGLRPSLNANRSVKSNMGWCEIAVSTACLFQGSRVTSDATCCDTIVVRGTARTGRFRNSIEVVSKAGRLQQPSTGATAAGTRSF